MKILIIRFKLMGDTILTTSLCYSLRLSFPDAVIDYIIYAPYDQLLEHHTAITNVIGIDEKTRKSPFRYLRFVKRVANNNYDIVIDAQGTAKSNFFSLFSRKAKYKISSARKRLSFGFSHQLPKLQSVDKIEERLHLLTPLTEEYDIKKSHSFELTITDDEAANARRKLKELGIDLKRPLFAFAISANETFKRWSRLESMELVNFCRTEFGAQILLFHGLPDEKKDTNLLLSVLESPLDVFNNYEIESIRCLPAIFSQCDLFVGNEGGPRHVAQAVGTPSVAVFSPSANKQEWLPSNDPLHQGFEWRDVVGHQFDEGVEYELGDSRYYRRYNSIKADMVKPLIRQVFTNSKSKPVKLVQ